MKLELALRVVGGAVALLALVVAVVLFAARFADGPLGGPLEIVAAGPEAARGAMRAF